MNLYSVKDEVAETFGRPFPAHNNGMAIRTFIGEVNNSESGLLHTNSKDFTLYLIGEFDEDTGNLVPSVPGPHRLINGSEAKSPA